MRLDHKKVLSIFIALFMVFGTVFNFNPKAMAAQNDDMKSKEEVLQALGENVKMSSEMLEKLKIQSEKIEFNDKGTGLAYNEDGLINDNLPEDFEKIDPNENVRLIVELNGKAVKDIVPRTQLQSAANDSNIVNNVLATQQSTINSVKQVDDNINIRRRYSTLLNGFSMEAKYRDIEEIKGLPNVKNVSVANKYYLDMNNAKGLTTNVENVWKELGYKGEGMVVSIIDTGIDYKHKDMVLSETTTSSAIMKGDIDESLSGQYFTAKVPYGYNYADDNLQVIPAPGTSSHGMHVAGIVGANCLDEKEIEVNKGIKGLAPECQLLAMKVFSNDPHDSGAYSDDVVAAIEDSVKLGADVINMSLGATAAFQKPNDAEQKAVREATEQGTVVVISAGNSQYSTAPYKFNSNKDTGLVGAPGLAHESLQVASFENDYVTGTAVEYKVDGQSKLGVYSKCSIDPIEVLSNPEGYEFVYCGFGGTEEEFAGKDLNGKIALIQRGKYDFTLKQELAEKHGAIAVIIFNDDRGDALVSMQEAEGLTIPAMFIGNTNGKAIKESNSRLYFKEQFAVIENVDKGDMSDFSSWGPTPNLDFKPQITGVGGNVWSTVTDDKYENMSGTSMASPHVAGCMALVLQHIDKMGMEFDSQEAKVEFAKNLVINTAVVKMEKEENVPVQVPFSPRRQGAGLINTDAALKNKVIATYNGEAVIPLKEIDNKTTFTINLKNHGDKNITYDVKTIGGVLTEQESPRGYTGNMSYDEKLKGASISFDKNTFTITTGASIDLNVTIDMSDNTPKDCFAEGFIRFIPQDKKVPEIGIPFMGFYGQWDKEQIIEDPMYSDSDILYGFTTLLNKDTQYLGQIGKTEKGDVIVKPELFAINPRSDKEDTFKDVMPILTFMRNARDVQIQIEQKQEQSDPEKEDKFNVIRTVSKDEYLSKAVLGSKAPDYHLNKNWVWDGTVFDNKSGNYEVVEDGEYFVNIRSRVDFEGSEYQDFRMPVKVDTVGPTAQFLSGTENKDENYKLEFKLNDLTSIERYSIFALDGIDDKEIDEKDIIKTVKVDGHKNEGTFSCDIELKDSTNLIGVIAIDYLNNSKVSIIPVENLQKQSLTITSPKWNEVVKAGESVTVKYEITEAVKGLVDKYSVILLNNEFEIVQSEPNVKETEYTFNNLQAGEYLIFVTARSVPNEEGKSTTIASELRKIFVEGEKAFVEFSNIEPGNTVGSADYKLEGLVQALPKSLKINGEEVTIGTSENPLAFTHVAHFEAGKLNKLKIDVIDKDDTEYHYAYNVFCDVKAPVINLTQPVQDSENPNRVSYDIVVPKEAEKYTVKGTVMDDMFGYKFYIDGEQIINVDLGEDISGEATLKEFEHEVQLNDYLTVVELRAKDGINETIRRINIYKGEKTLPIIIENLNENAEFNNGDQAKISIKASNKSLDEINVALSIGLFNEDGKMIRIIGNEQVVRGNDSIVLNGIMDIPSEGKYTLRCFIWDEFKAGRPLSNVIEYQIGK